MSPTASGARWVSRAVDLGLYVALPIIGVLLLGWDWRPIVLLYWLENITIGGVTFIGLIRTRMAARAAGAAVAGMHPAFFLVHYGMFTLVHGVFVGVLVLIPLPLGERPAEPFSPLLLVGIWAAVALTQWVIAATTAATPSGGVGRAYGRIFALHLAILGGVWLIISLGLPAVVAIALVVLHAIADAVLFATERGVASGRWKVTQTSPGSWELRRADERP